MSEGKLIFKKMSLVMADVGPVGKDQSNKVQGYKFRGIDQFVNALHPALVKHGVFMTPECVAEHHELKEVERSSGKAGIDKHIHLLMKYHFHAEDGSSVTVGPIPAEGLDSGDKATNKALSAALKYALIQTFCVPTEDMAEADLDTPTIGTRPTNVQTAKLVSPPVQVAAVPKTTTTGVVATSGTVPMGTPAPVQQTAVTNNTPAITVTVNTAENKPIVPAAAPAKPTFKKPSSNTKGGW